MDGTTTHFNISKDGQMVSYSTNGVIWSDINYQKWHGLILNLMEEIKKEVAHQMPSGMTVSDLKGNLILDDLSKVAPYRQKKNLAHVEVTTKKFIDEMASPAEKRHHLYNKDGTLSDNMITKYILQDQKIKGLLSALLTSCSPVPIRSWQFGSIVFDSCDGVDRNVWIVDGHIVIGKPKAKQLKLAFADTIFQLPPAITLDLIAFLYYQQPFISSLLTKTGTPGLLYSSHVWALPSPKSRAPHSKVWNGQDINQAIRALTQQLIGSPVDPPLARQSSQGLLRDKIPVLFEIFQSRDNLYLEKGSYRHQSCLEAYANSHNLQGLAQAADIPIHCVSACLIICDIWLSLHKIAEVDPIWEPMVIGSYIFPTVAHDDFAYFGAQNLSMIASTSHGLTSDSQCIFDEENLTQGVTFLADIQSLDAKVCL